MGSAETKPVHSIKAKHMRAIFSKTKIATSSHHRAMHRVVRTPVSGVEHHTQDAAADDGSLTSEL